MLRQELSSFLSYQNRWSYRQNIVDNMAVSTQNIHHNHLKIAHVIFVTHELYNEYVFL